MHTVIHMYSYFLQSVVSELKKFEFSRQRELEDKDEDKELFLQVCLYYSFYIC